MNSQIKHIVHLCSLSLKENSQANNKRIISGIILFLILILDRTMFPPDGPWLSSDVDNDLLLSHYIQIQCILNAVVYGVH